MVEARWNFATGKAGRELIFHSPVLVSRNTRKKYTNQFSRRVVAMSSSGLRINVSAGNFQTIFSFIDRIFCHLPFFFIQSVRFIWAQLRLATYYRLDSITVDSDLITGRPRIIYFFAREVSISRDLLQLIHVFVFARINLE